MKLHSSAFLLLSGGGSSFLAVVQPAAAAATASSSSSTIVRPHAFLAPWDGGRRMSSSPLHKKQHADDNSFETNILQQQLPRDLVDSPAALPTKRRQKRHLYGASMTRGSWRSLLQGSSTSSGEETEAIVNAVNSIAADARTSGENRSLQSSTSTTAMTTCKASIPLEEAVGKDYGTSCECTANTSDRSALLVCKDMACAYCNDAESACTSYSYGVVFDNSGMDVEYFEEDIYTLGERTANGAIRYTERDGECSVSVGGTECSQCVMEDCGDDYWGIQVSCSNVESGAAYNSCQDGFSTTSVFQAYNEEEFDTCRSNFDVCQIEANNIEDRYDCFCEDSTAANGNASATAASSSNAASHLKCQDKCEYCNDLFSVCGQEQYEQSFVNAMLSGTKRTISYTSGRSETVIYEESNCDVDPSVGCQDCTLQVDGVMCDSCSIQTCRDGSRAPQVSCGNVEDVLVGKTVDFCSANTLLSLTGTVLEYFKPGFTNSCTTKAQLACHETKTKYEEHPHEFVCDCVKQDDAGTMELQCEATCGEFCNNEESVCVRESIYQDFLMEGSSSYLRKDVQYTAGRKEKLSYVEFEDGICSMTIDGVECRSCVVKTCAAHPTVDKAPLIDCSDIEGGAVLDLCEPELVVEQGIFERFSMNEFQECLDRTPVNGVCSTSLAITSLPHTTTGSTLLVPSDNTLSCGATESFAPGLWYNLMGTGTGVEASLCEAEADFLAHISVYSGMDCSQLECFAASEKDCKVLFLAKEGVQYNIRVHGMGASIGNFGLTVSEYNLGTSECESAKKVLETNPDLTTTCRDCEAPDEDGHVHLHCSMECSSCDETGSVCATRAASSKFDMSGSVVSSKQHYQFDIGRSEYLTIHKFDCNGEEDCASCEVEINDEVCGSCSIVNCGGATQGIDAVCGNATINTCESDAVVDNSNLFHPLIDGSYDECFSRDPLVACADHLKYEQNLGQKIQCECQAEKGDSSSSSGGDARLLCQQHDCLHCNQERTICGYEAFGSIFESAFGHVSGKFKGFKFVEGRTDLVAHHIPNDGGDPSSSECMVTINDATCETCLANTCPSGEGQGMFHGFTFDCQNVPDGLFYDGCSPIGLPGPFEFINSPDFESCVETFGARETCEAALLETMTAKSTLQNLCGCHATENGGYELICTDTEDCLFCSDRKAEAVCADYTEYRVEINRFGSFIAHVNSFQYTSGGRDELLVIRDNDFECQVTISGEICSSCAWVECSEEVGAGRSMSIDCSNILDDGATYECGVGNHDIFTAISLSSQYVCAGDSTKPPTEEATTEAPAAKASSSAAAARNKTTSASWWLLLSLAAAVSGWTTLLG